MFVYITNFILKNALNGVLSQEITIYNDRGGSLVCTRLVLNAAISLEEYIYQKENLQELLSNNIKLNSLNYVYILSEKDLTLDERKDVLNYMRQNESLLKDSVLQTTEFCSFAPGNMTQTLADIGTCYLYLNEFTIETINRYNQLVYYKFKLLNDDDASLIFKHTRRLIRVVDCNTPNNEARFIVSKNNNMICVSKADAEVESLVHTAWLLLPKEFEKITKTYARTITPENLIIHMTSWFNMIDRAYDMDYIISYKVDKSEAINLSNVLKMESLGETTINSLNIFKIIANKETLNANAYEIQTKYYTVFIGQTDNIKVIDMISSCT